VTHRIWGRANRPDSGTLYTARRTGVSEGKIDIAVLASGSGTNFQALIDTTDVASHIRIVVSDKPAAGALVRATNAGIETAVVRWQDHPDRDGFSSAIADLVEESGAKGVVLAGFMRVLSSPFIDRFPNRILNIHPSLLPSFPGANAVHDALEHGVKVTGVTVHFVDEKVDHGPVIAQRSVPVESDDTVETLHARIQVEEHDLYPTVVRALVQGDLTVDGRKVGWR
jgi:phosphoribosylglycinamide formyltransferase 1